MKSSEVILGLTLAHITCPLLLLPPLLYFRAEPIIDYRTWTLTLFATVLHTMALLFKSYLNAMTDVAVANTLLFRDVILGILELITLPARYTRHFWLVTLSNRRQMLFQSPDKMSREVVLKTVDYATEGAAWKYFGAFAFFPFALLVIVFVEGSLVYGSLYADLVTSIVVVYLTGSLGLFVWYTRMYPRDGLDIKQQFLGLYIVALVQGISLIVYAQNITISDISLMDDSIYLSTLYISTGIDLLRPVYHVWRREQSKESNQAILTKILSRKGRASQVGRSSTNSHSSVTMKPETPKPHKHNSKNESANVKGLSADLEAVLKSKSLMDALTQFTASEFCVENALFLRAMQNYRNMIDLTNESSSFSMAWQIFQQFITRGAINEFNLPQNRVNDFMEMEEGHGDGLLTIFDEAEAHIMTNLVVGTMGRFKKSSLYKNAIANQQDAKTSGILVQSPPKILKSKSLMPPASANE